MLRGSALAVALVLFAASVASAQQIIPDIWPWDESKVEATGVEADTATLDLLKEKGVITQEEYDKTVASLAKDRLTDLHPEGALAVGYTPYNEMKYDEVIDYPGSPSEDRNFQVNKAELGVAGTVLYPWLSTKWSVDADTRDDGKLGLRVDQAFMRAKGTPKSLESGAFVPAWGATLGAQKIPFSRQSLYSTTQLQFINRSIVVNEMPIRYDLGFTTHQDYKLKLGPDRREWVKLSIDAGAYNGQGDHVYANDNNDNLMYAGRARLDLFSPMRAGEGDTMPRYWPTRILAKNAEAVRPQLSFGYSMLQNNDIDRIVKSMGFDGEFRFSGLSVQAEYIVTRYEPDFAGNISDDQFAQDWETSGWYVQGGLFVIPRHLEFAARYEKYMLDLLTDVEDERELVATTYGLNVHLASNHGLKFQFDYTSRGEIKGMPEIDNDTFSMQGVLNF